MRSKALTTTTGMRGWTDIALFDQDGTPKRLFHANFLWKLAKQHLGLDLQIPLLFGFWSRRSLRFNTITDVGKKIAADQTGGTTTTPVTAIAIGVGTPSTTALGSESTTNGGSRGVADRRYDTGAKRS